MQIRELERMWEMEKKFFILFDTYCSIEDEKAHEHPLSEDAYYLDGCLWGIQFAICTSLDIKKSKFKDLLADFKENYH